MSRQFCREVVRKNKVVVEECKMEEGKSTRLKGRWAPSPYRDSSTCPGHLGQRANGPKKSEPPAERERWQPTPLTFRQPFPRNRDKG